MGYILESLPETKMSEKEILECVDSLNNKKSSDGDCMYAGAHYDEIVP